MMNVTRMAMVIGVVLFGCRGKPLLRPPAISAAGSCGLCEVPHSRCGSDLPTGGQICAGMVARVTRPLPIAVLVSGAGTNLQALLDTVHGREAELVAVALTAARAPALGRS